MVFRDVYLELDRLKYPTEVAYPFKLRSRCLCHFVGRHAWKRQLRVPGFNRIVVNLAAHAEPKFQVNVCHVASIDMPLTADTFETIEGDALHEFYIAHLTAGVDRFLGDFPELTAEIHQGVAAFRAGGYRNEWIEKSRRFRDLDLSASLSCRMTVERFALRLTLRRKEAIVYDQEILSTDPDEIAFEYRFKDVIAADGGIIVVSKHSRRLVTLTMAQIEANQPPDKIGP